MTCFHNADRGCETLTARLRKGNGKSNYMRYPITKHHSFTANLLTFHHQCFCRLENSNAAQNSHKEMERAMRNTQSDKDKRNMQ